MIQVDNQCNSKRTIVIERKIAQNLKKADSKIHDVKN